MFDKPPVSIDRPPSHSPPRNTPIELVDPTSLAITIIPLLLSNPSSSASAHSSTHSHPLDPSLSTNISLPSLAASLSTLPPSVIKAIDSLATELKKSREQSLLSNHHLFQSLPTPSGDQLPPQHDREQREKWLENQKLNHLKKSIGSLTSLHSTLQARHLSTLDTLSNLQQIHKSKTQSLTYERDGVRAVNKVLKRKILNLEKELAERQKIMESVLERVNVVNKGDWSILDHGQMEIYHPLTSESNSTDHLCSFHNKLKPILDHQRPSERPLLASLDHSKRSLTLIAELTEELETLRNEIRTELKQKIDEIGNLKTIVGFRDHEIDRLMSRLTHFMGLDGFYVSHHQISSSPSSPSSPSDPNAAQHQLSEIDPELNLTPRAKDHSNTKTTIKKKIGIKSPPIKQNRPRSDLSHHPPFHQLELERQIRELEFYLEQSGSHSVYQSSQTGPKPPPCGLAENEFNQEDRDGQFTLNNPFQYQKSSSERSSSSSSSHVQTNSQGRDEDEDLSRVLKDLSIQVKDLKGALKEVCKERDSLKKLQARKPSHSIETSSAAASSSSSSFNPHFDDPFLGPLERTTNNIGNNHKEGKKNENELRELLKQSREECNKLSSLLIRSENKVKELEIRLNEQEIEFEKVAERVKEKLQEQRSKLMQAKMKIEGLELEIELLRNHHESQEGDSVGEERRESTKEVDYKTCDDGQHSRFHPLGHHHHHRHHHQSSVSSSASSASSTSSFSVEPRLKKQTQHHPSSHLDEQKPHSKDRDIKKQ